MQVTYVLVIFLECGCMDQPWCFVSEEGKYRGNVCGFFFVISLTLLVLESHADFYIMF